MPVNTNVKISVFGAGNEPSDESLLENITEEQRQLAREMMKSGHYQDGIYIPKFLRDDLSINLEKLEFAVTLSMIMLEANSEEDVTLQLKGLKEYYLIRGILGDEKQERTERTFILGFVTSVAAEASDRDTLQVKYAN